MLVEVDRDKFWLCAMCIVDQVLSIIIPVSSLTSMELQQSESSGLGQVFWKVHSTYKSLVHPTVSSNVVIFFVFADRSKSWCAFLRRLPETHLNPALS